MDRRTASGLILTGSLAAPALIRPDLSWATNPEAKDDDDDAELARFATPAIRVAARHVVLKWLLIGTATGGWLGMKLGRNFQQHNEKLAGIGGILGQLTRPTVTQRMRAAKLVGTLHLVSQSLVFLPQTEFAYQKAEYLLFHDYLSWDLQAAWRIVQLGDRTPEQIRSQGAPIGAAYLTAALLVMLLINPVIGRTWKVS